MDPIGQNVQPSGLNKKYILIAGVILVLLGVLAYLFYRSDQVKEQAQISPESKNEEQRYLTRKEVARYLGVALSTVDLWSRTGKLRKINVNGSIRFDKYEVDRIFDSKSDKI